MNYSQINQDITNKNIINNNKNQINNVRGMVNNNTNRFSAPVNFNVGNGVLGSYDNIQFNTQCKQNPWKSPPCNPPLTSNLVFVPQGTPLPLQNETIYTELPQDSMFVFSKTMASPYCSSTYSTDRGQLCTTDEVRGYIGQERGFNKTYENYNF